MNLKRNKYEAIYLRYMCSLALGRYCGYSTNTLSHPEEDHPQLFKQTTRNTTKHASRRSPQQPKFITSHMVLCVANHFWFVYRIVSTIFV
ncbi:hypothetical protein V2G26_010044 [Clonostachys chloroleuca]